MLPKMVAHGQVLVTKRMGKWTHLEIVYGQCRIRWTWILAPASHSSVIVHGCISAGSNTEVCSPGMQCKRFNEWGDYKYTLLSYCISTCRIHSLYSFQLLLCQVNSRLVHGIHVSVAHETSLSRGLASSHFYHGVQLVLAWLMTVFQSLHQPSPLSLLLHESGIAHCSDVPESLLMGLWSTSGWPVALETDRDKCR